MAEIIHHIYQLPITKFAFTAAASNPNTDSLPRPRGSIPALAGGEWVAVEETNKITIALSGEPNAI